MSRVNELEGELIAARRRRKTTRADQEKRLASVERALSCPCALRALFPSTRAANLYQVRSPDALRTYERATCTPPRNVCGGATHARALPGGGGADGDEPEREFGDA